MEGEECVEGSGDGGGGYISLRQLCTQSSGREMKKGLDFGTMSQGVVTR